MVPQTPPLKCQMALIKTGSQSGGATGLYIGLVYVFHTRWHNGAGVQDPNAW